MLNSDGIPSSIPKCIIQACLNTSAPALKRGLCMTCHVRAKRMVESGTTTWPKLVKMGLALSLDEEDVDPFMREFTKRSKECQQ